MSTKNEQFARACNLVEAGQVAQICINYEHQRFTIGMWDSIPVSTPFNNMIYDAEMDPASWRKYGTSIKKSTC